ncbi:hypothetical protein L1049_023254 [Liquidambar formosana]|uniref:APO domain-containing protein n=1 Tax=Liquidambar formosana TaxID=63359 RepID=A0AAP0WS71_LIQFO
MASTSAITSQIPHFHGHCNPKMSISTPISYGLDFGSPHLPFGTRALSDCKATVLPSKVGPFRVSYRTKLEFLKLNTHPHLSSLDALKYSGSKLKLPSKSRILTQNMCKPFVLIVRSNHPQNADFPRYYSRKEKKPFPIPIVELRRAARERCKSRKGQPKRPAPPPKNGLVVKRLIPLAYDVLNARVTLINNLKKLLRVVPVHACTDNALQ